MPRSAKRNVDALSHPEELPSNGAVPGELAEEFSDNLAIDMRSDSEEESGEEEEGDDDEQTLVGDLSGTSWTVGDQDESSVFEQDVGKRKNKISAPRKETKKELGKGKTVSSAVGKKALDVESENEGDEEGEGSDEQDSDDYYNDEEEDLNAGDLFFSSDDENDEEDDDQEILEEIEPGYSSDSSTEETTNTVGNIPMEWYDDLPHIGYDKEGKKIMKSAVKDELDAFLQNVDDVDGWRTVQDKLEGKDVKLTDEELDIIKRLHSQQYTDSSYDPYEPLVEFFSSKALDTPVTGKPEPKRRFIPSKWEASHVMKLVRMIRAGILKPARRTPMPPKPEFYDLWGPGGGDEETSRENHPAHIAAPKMRLPEHAESYNPPVEYLLSEEERKKWESTDAEDRERNYMPMKNSNLRTVPAYDRFVQERFDRCLDLYLCPRVKKNRLIIDPESLIPKLPDPRDLEPFPRSLAVTYRGHTGRIRCLSMDPSGLWLATGGDDGDVRLWEISTGRCVRVWTCGDGDEPVQSLEWCPNKDVWILAAAFDNKIALIVPPEGNDPLAIEFADKLARSGFAESLAGAAEGSQDSAALTRAATWSRPTASQEEQGWRVVITVARGFLKQISWHKKGDYFSSLAPDANTAAVLVHQLSKHATQSPFKKAKGRVQKVLFHPIKPFLFVATQRYVRVYNLLKQELARSLQPNCKWISSLAIHPSGDHVLIGSYDRRVCWFDLDLASRPYKTLRHHEQAVRSVAYAARSGYPLFATASDDGSVQVFYGQVYADLLQNPLLVPVKRLKNAHQVTNGLGVLDCQWHPTQPWLLTCGADGLAKLWS